MDDEIRKLNIIIKMKNSQLKEQLSLIRILVQRLFNVNVGLKFLEERAQSLVRLNRYSGRQAKTSFPLENTIS